MAFLFYAAIGLSIAICVLAQIELPLKQSIATLAFLGNYEPLSPGIFGHFWSLAVEEHFYIFLPAVFFALIKISPERPFRHIPTICVVLAVGVPLAARLCDISAGRFAFETHMRMDKLICRSNTQVFLSFQPIDVQETDASLVTIRNCVSYACQLSFLMWTPVSCKQLA